MEYVEELESVPEPDHVERVMDGFIDTISGSESFTSSQHYLEGVLYSNGIITHRQIGGTEGILGKVGDGVKAAIEYIKKMFRSIWEFFFKSDKKKMEDQVDKALDDAKKDLDAMEKAKVTPENVDSALSKAATEVNKLKDGPEKTKLKEKVEEAKASKDTAFKVKIASVIPGEIYEAWRVPDIIAQAYQAKFVVAIGKMESLQKKQKDEGDKHGLVADIQRIINAGNAMPKTAAVVKDIAGASHYLDGAKKCSDEIIAALDSMAKKESEFKALIESIENGQDKEKAKASTAALKESLTGITTAIHEAKVMCRFIESAANVINKGCVMVI